MLSEMYSMLTVLDRRPFWRMFSAAVAARGVLVFCCCLTLALFFVARAAYAGSTPGHGQELNQSEKKPAAKQSTAKPAGQAVTKPATAKSFKPVAPRTGQSAASGKKASGLKGFSGNPFSLEQQKRPASSAQQAANAQNAPAGQRSARTTEANSATQEPRVVFSGGKHEKTDDRLVPRRSAFSGGADTLPHMDEKSPPEMSMTYRMNNRASTKVSVNQQDETSPLYVPGRKENGVNGAGVYMNMDVKKDLQLQLGGEYHEIDDDHRSEDAKGASVGLRWNF